MPPVSLNQEIIERLARSIEREEDLRSLVHDEMEGFKAEVYARLKKEGVIS
jgi:hypothetical protein